MKPHSSQEWHEWEVVDRNNMDRMCVTSCEIKANLIKDALEALHTNDKHIQ